MTLRIQTTYEYLFKCSSKFLFKYLSSPSGLNDWYAENVAYSGGNYTFSWGSDERVATISEQKANHHIKFLWSDSDGTEFLEFRMKEDDLTGELSLQITDFCDKEDLETIEEIWNNAVTILREKTGA